MDNGYLLTVMGNGQLLENKTPWQQGPDRVRRGDGMGPCNT
jgi:hypothetical protein